MNKNKIIEEFETTFPIATTHMGTNGEALQDWLLKALTQHEEAVEKRYEKRINRKNKEIKRWKKAYTTQQKTISKLKEHEEAVREDEREKCVQIVKESRTLCEHGTMGVSLYEQGARNQAVTDLLTNN